MIAIARVWLIIRYATSIPRPRAHIPRLPGLFATLMLAVCVAPAGAQPVSCSPATNLCTGNPCTIPVVEVQSPCVVDFGAVDLVIGGKIELPDDGVLDFTAQNIEVRGRIDGNGSNGSQVSLTATNDILVHSRIDTSGRTTPGALTLDAGGNVTIDRKIVSRCRGGTATGGTVTIAAGGAVSVSRRVKMDVRGKRKTTTGGQVTVNGDTGVTFSGQIDTRGSDAGMIILASSTGDVTIEHKLRAVGDPGNGGTVDLTAGGTVTSTGKGKVTVKGRGGGGTINVSGDAGVSLLRKLTARGTFGGGGMVVITSTSGDVVVDKIDSKARQPGGSVAISTPNGSITVESIKVTARTGMGGTVTLDALANITSLRKIEVDGETGGEIRLATASGDILMDGSFEARGFPGGTIEAQAGGNLTASGNFRADGGCIGLAAGGTLDTSAGSFDGPIVSSCP